MLLNCFSANLILLLKVLYLAKTTKAEFANKGGSLNLSKLLKTTSGLKVWDSFFYSYRAVFFKLHEVLGLGPMPEICSLFSPEYALPVVG